MRPNARPRQILASNALTSQPASKQNQEGGGLITLVARLASRVMNWLILVLVLSIFVSLVQALILGAGETVDRGNTLLAREVMQIDLLLDEQNLLRTRRHLAASIIRVIDEAVNGGFVWFRTVQDQATRSVRPLQNSKDRSRSATTPVMHVHIEAVIYTVKVYTVRLLVIFFGIPTFALFVLVGFVDGLIRRDVRTWSGGRESSLIYHLAKYTVGPVIGWGTAIYMCLPFTVSPVWPIFVIASTTALSISLLVSRFKKYA